MTKPWLGWPRFEALHVYIALSPAHQAVPLSSSPSSLREMTEKLQAVHRSEVAALQEEAGLVAALQEEAGLVEGRHQAELGRRREELEASHLEEIQQLTEAHRSVADIRVWVSDFRIRVSESGSGYQIFRFGYQTH